MAAARELAGQRVCFVGVGLPNVAVNLAQRTVAPDIELVYEAGVFGARPARLPLSIGDPTIVSGATAAISMFELFSFYLQGGLIDVGFLGAAQIDRFGNINTTVIGDYATPTTRLPGSGGACEIAINARQIFVIMRQSRRSFVDADRLPDLARQPGRGRPCRADPARAGLARARTVGGRSPTWGSTTSTRRARCASTRSIPGPAWKQVRETIGWEPQDQPRPGRDPGAHRDGAGSDARRAGSRRDCTSAEPGGTSPSVGLSPLGGSGGAFRVVGYPPGRSGHPQHGNRQPKTAASRQPAVVPQPAHPIISCRQAAQPIAIACPRCPGRKEPVEPDARAPRGDGLARPCFDLVRSLAPASAASRIAWPIRPRRRQRSGRWQSSSTHR